MVWETATDALGGPRAAFWLAAGFAAEAFRSMLVCLGLAKESHREELGETKPKGCRPRVMIAASDNSEASGAFRALVAMAELLERRHGFEVLALLPYEGTGTALLDAAGIRHALISSGSWIVYRGTDLKSPGKALTLARKLIFNAIAVRSVRRLIKREKIDIVHVNTTWTYVPALAALEEGVPLVWHLREFVEEDQGRTMWSRKTANALIAKADVALGISGAICRKYSGICGAGKLAKVYDGVETGRFDGGERAILAEKPYTFTIVGNFQRHKGHVEFAKACAMARKAGRRDFRVWFVGGGNEEVRAECENIIAEAGMLEMATFWGRQANPEKFLAKTDVAFMCSRAEAFGLVTVEAMMSGCLVAGADSGATPELLAEGKAGLVYSREEGAQAIAQAMERVFADPEGMRRLAEAGRRFALENFTAERNAKNVAETYLKLAKRAERAGGK